MKTRIRCLCLYLIAVFVSIVLAACHNPVFLSLDDAVVMQSTATIRLRAYVNRAGVLGMHHGVEDQKVNFFINGEDVGSAVTDDHGAATLEYPLLST
ncbi:MAG: hypothetical protein JSV03_05535, partial [Planctomycetota bacterium]